MASKSVSFERPFSLVETTLLETKICKACGKLIPYATYCVTCKRIYRQHRNRPQGLKNSVEVRLRNHLIKTHKTKAGNARRLEDQFGRIVTEVNGYSEHRWRMDPLDMPKFRILASQPGSTCYKCGGTGVLEIDHILPVALGGTNHGLNLQLLCEDCHKEKTRADIKTIRRQRTCHRR